MCFKLVWSTNGKSSFLAFPLWKQKQLLGKIPDHQSHLHFKLLEPFPTSFINNFCFEPSSWCPKNVSLWVLDLSFKVKFPPKACPGHGRGVFIFDFSVTAMALSEFCITCDVAMTTTLSLNVLFKPLRAVGLHRQVSEKQWHWLKTPAPIPDHYSPPGAGELKPAADAFLVNLMITLKLSLWKWYSNRVLLAKNG